MLVYSPSFTKLFISNEPDVPKDNNVVSYTYTIVNAFLGFSTKFNIIFPFENLNFDIDV